MLSFLALVVIWIRDSFRTRTLLGEEWWRDTITRASEADLRKLSGW